MVKKIRENFGLPPESYLQGSPRKVILKAILALMISYRNDSIVLKSNVFAWSPLLSGNRNR